MAYEATHQDISICGRKMKKTFSGRARTTWLGTSVQHRRKLIDWKLMFIALNGLV